MSAPAFSRAVPCRLRRWWWLGFGLLVLAVTGCSSVGYYRQAAAGQMEIWRRRENISTVLERTNTPATLRSQLELVLRLREFAEHELHLETDGHYAKYADLGRRFVVWNVYAAPEFSLRPHQWWYPVVGSLKYRGFFSEAEARACAERMAREGWDVYVGGVEAYSTLGFFRDPVLNTFVHHPAPDLAETLFHELAHQRVFVSGDTDFNEAFATVAGMEGARRWIARHGDAAMRQEYERTIRREEQFVALVMAARAELKRVYGEPTLDDNNGGQKKPAPAIPPAEAAAWRERKEAVLIRLRQDYEKLKADWGGHGGYDKWFARPINNARLNTIATYFTLVPAFRALLAEHGGDLEKFYTAVEQLSELPKKERHRRLALLTSQGTETARP